MHRYPLSSAFGCLRLLPRAGRFGPGATRAASSTRGRCTSGLSPSRRTRTLDIPPPRIPAPPQGLTTSRVQPCPALCNHLSLDCGVWTTGGFQMPLKMPARGWHTHRANLSYVLESLPRVAQSTVQTQGERHIAHECRLG